MDAGAWISVSTGIKRCYLLRAAQSKSPIREGREGGRAAWVSLVEIGSKKFLLGDLFRGLLGRFFSGSHVALGGNPGGNPKGHLPKHNDRSSRAWLYGKLLVTLLAQKVIRIGRDISPSVRRLSVREFI